MWTEEEDRAYREMTAKANRVKLPWWKWVVYIAGWLVFLSVLDALFGVSRGGWLI